MSEKKDEDKTFVDQLNGLLTQEDLEKIRARAYLMGQLVEQITMKALMWAREPDFAVEALAKALGRAAASADIPPPIMTLLVRVALEEYKSMRARLTVQTFMEPLVPAKIAPKSEAKTQDQTDPSKDGKKEVN